MKLQRVLRSGWRWSWLLTLPISVAFGAWLRTTWQRHRAFRVEQATLADFSLRAVGALTFGEMLRHVEVDWLRLRDRQPLAGIRTLDLHIPDVVLARLDADLPHSGLEFVKTPGRVPDASGAITPQPVWCALGAGGRTWRVQVRYRGDNVYHWGYRKKSFRVRTRKEDLFEGLRAFNLIAPRAPELLNNYLAYRLARRLGLIAPRAELVEVRVNGDVRGVHVLTEQLDESTLRAQSYMPGDLYSGDAVGQKAHAGIDNDLFRSAALWEKQSANNHYDLESRAPLEALLAVVNAPPSEARQARLREILDIEAFAAFSALEILCATIHVDTEHNWRLYYDANRRRFVPVVWDLFGWDPSNAPMDGDGPRLDVLSSPLHALLHEDGGFLAARQRLLARFLTGAEDELFLAQTDREIAALVPAIERDPELTMQAQAFRPATIVAAMRALRDHITGLWAKLEDAYARPRQAVRFWRTGTGVGLAVEDRVPIRRIRLQLAQAVRPGSAVVRWVRQSETVATDVTAAMSARGSEIVVDTTLQARHVLQLDSMRTYEVKSNSATIRRATYELVIEGVDPTQIVDVRCERGDAHWESAVEGTAASCDLGRVWRAVEPRPVVPPRTWRGEVELAGVTEIHEPLRIEPGTIVRLGPDASLVLRGVLLARGTAAAPIRFEASGDKPWGALALQGQGASGSHLVHCEFRDGSGLKTALFEYSAMLSLHDVRDVVLEHCHLRDSRVVDDMLHAVYADVMLRDCSFTRALSDAVDFDISHGTFERCAFERSGNDGLDLMTASALVVDCTFLGCGDKGISVGEGSRLLALRPQMTRCNFGVQGKDDSTAAVVGAQMHENKCAIDAYKKNWRYGSGGRVYVYNSTLAGNEKIATADRDSRILLRDCALDAPVLPGPGRIVVEGGVPAGPIRRDKEELRLLRDVEARRQDR